MGGWQTLFNSKNDVETSDTEIQASQIVQNNSNTTEAENIVDPNVAKLELEKYSFKKHSESTKIKQTWAILALSVVSSFLTSLIFIRYFSIPSHLVSSTSKTKFYPEQHTIRSHPFNTWSNEVTISLITSTESTFDHLILTFTTADTSLIHNEGIELFNVKSNTVLNLGRQTDGYLYIYSKNITSHDQVKIFKKSVNYNQAILILSFSLGVFSFIALIIGLMRIEHLFLKEWSFENKTCIILLLFTLFQTNVFKIYQVYLTISPIYEYTMNVVSSTLFFGVYILVARTRLMTPLSNTRLVTVSQVSLLISCLVLTPVKQFHPNNQFMRFLTPILSVQHVFSILFFIASLGTQVVMFRRLKYLEKFQLGRVENLEIQAENAGTGHAGTLSSTKSIQFSIFSILLYFFCLFCYSCDIIVPRGETMAACPNSSFFHLFFTLYSRFSAIMLCLISFF